MGNRRLGARMEIGIQLALSLLQPLPGSDGAHTRGLRGTMSRRDGSLDGGVQIRCEEGAKPDQT
jgi:hypothetical protein